MSIKKKKTVSETVEKIIKVIDNTSLNFNKKRFIMIQNIKSYYMDEELSTQEIIERKNTLLNSSSLANLFLIPFFVGACSALLTQGFINSIKVLRVESTFIQIILNCIVIVFFSGGFCLIWQFFNTLLSIRKRYARYDLLDHELEIIDMILEARNLLENIEDEKSKSNQE